MTTEPVSRAFNVAVLHIASKVLPCGFDVSADAPQDFDSLMVHYKKTGRVLVWVGASEQTIFADEEVNYAFRAWHDSKHILGELPFTREGEAEAMREQMKDILALYDGEAAALFCCLLRAEILGQFDYQERYGGFPVDQIGFVSAYLTNRSVALSGYYGVSTVS